MDKQKGKSIGLWEKKSKNGVRYWSYVDKESQRTFTLFHNQSENPKAPTFNLLIGKLDEQASKGSYQKRPAARKKPAPVDDFDPNEDMPF